jgi:hypothetical protein
MISFIRSLLRTKQHEPHYVRMRYVTAEENEYNRKKSLKGKLHAFTTTFPDGSKSYTVEYLEQVEPDYINN